MSLSFLSRLRTPFSAQAARIVLLIGAINICVWIGVGIVLHYYSSLVSTAILAYTLGLRHALDADHISAIDLMIRRLLASGRRPATVGMWFSLGHSTIVIITCIVVAATVRDKLDGFSFSRAGQIVGGSISSAVLLILGAMNAWILWKLTRRMGKALRGEGGETEAGEAAGLEIKGFGCLGRLFKGMFKLIDRLKSAGMCLVDTTDGALMLTLYTSANLAHDQIAILYYSTALTAVTVVVALVIGIIQLLTLILNAAESTGSFWDGVGDVSDHYDIVGGTVCGSFLFFGLLSIVCYKPWRRRVEKKYAHAVRVDRRADAEEGCLDGAGEALGVGNNQVGKDKPVATTNKANSAGEGSSRRN
ncbi:MAG: hypothetical protein M1829_001894 [Trizodia sp. TS-e1964]|nr:MAG: hypothetical protein M1829_001894 [Trizodia sp. TS-e1964]